MKNTPYGTDSEAKQRLMVVDVEDAPEFIVMLIVDPENWTTW